MQEDISAIWADATERERLEFLAMPPDRQELVRRRLPAVLELLAPHKTRRAADLAAQAGCARAQLYRLAERFRATGSISALAPFGVPERARKSRLDDRTVALVDRVVTEVLAATPAAFVSEIHQRVAELAREDGLPVPSPAAVRRRVDRYRGRPDAKVNQLPSRRRKRPALVPQAFGEVLVIDHTVVDLAVVDERGNEGLPLLTLAIDQWSRLVLGSALTMATPGRRSVRFAMLDARRNYASTAWPAGMKAVPGHPVSVSCDVVGEEWKEIRAAFAWAGFKVIGPRSARPPRGDAIARLVGPSLDRFKLHPRLAFRPVEERIRRSARRSSLRLADAHGLVELAIEQHNRRVATSVPVLPIRHHGSEEPQVDHLAIGLTRFDEALGPLSDELMRSD